MIFVLYMLGHVFYFREQRWFVYAEGFKLLPDLLLLRFIDDVHFVAEVEWCGLAFIAIDTIKEECPGLPDYARIVKHRFYTKDSLDILWVNHILKWGFSYLISCSRYWISSSELKSFLSSSLKPSILKSIGRLAILETTLTASLSKYLISDVWTSNRNSFRQRHHSRTQIQSYQRICSNIQEACRQGIMLHLDQLSK